MDLNNAISILEDHFKTGKAVAGYVGYKPEYYYALRAVGEDMPPKAKQKIIRAAELLILRKTNMERGCISTETPA